MECRCLDGHPVGKFSTSFTSPKPYNCYPVFALESVYGLQFLLSISRELGSLNDGERNLDEA